jgi:hypothetical protein
MTSCIHPRHRQTLGEVSESVEYLQGKIYIIHGFFKTTFLPIFRPTASDSHY